MSQFKIEPNDDSSSSSSDNSTTPAMNDQTGQAHNGFYRPSLGRPVCTPSTTYYYPTYSYNIQGIRNCNEKHPVYNGYYEEPSYRRRMLAPNHTIYVPDYPVNIPETPIDYSRNACECPGCYGKTFVSTPVPEANHAFLPEYLVGVKRNKGITESGQVGNSQMEFFYPCNGSHGCAASSSNAETYVLKMIRPNPDTETRVVDNDHAYIQVDSRNFQTNLDGNFQGNSVAPAARPDRKRRPETSNTNISPDEYNRYMEDLARWSVAAAPTQAYAPELSSRPSTIVKMEPQEENLLMAVKVEPLAEDYAETKECKALVTTQKVKKEEIPTGYVAKLVKVESMTKNEAKTVKVEVKSGNTARTVIVQPQRKQRIWSGRIKRR